jgi:protein TonB
MFIKMLMAAFLLVAQPASANAANFIATRSGWDVFRDEGVCAMRMEFEGQGETQLTLLKDAGGKIATFITNTEWTSREGEYYDVSFVLNGDHFGGGKSKGTGEDLRKGFMSMFGLDFERAFARGSSLQVYLGKERIDDLSLKGTSGALSAVNNCLAEIRAGMAVDEREKARWAYLPKDPFAYLPLSELNRKAAPKGADGSWLTADDYPFRALRVGRQGRTAFTLTIGQDGRVIDCHVTESSGSPDLDAATCSNFSQRGRFVPATDGTGHPIQGSYASSVNWSLPQ